MSDHGPRRDSKLRAWVKTVKGMAQTDADGCQHAATFADMVAAKRSEAGEKKPANGVRANERPRPFSLDVSDDQLIDVISYRSFDRKQSIKTYRLVHTGMLLG